MTRPKVPLISKREVVRTALAIVDAEGMEALSIRRLGAALHVNGASLYHHFADKDEILMAVGRAVLGEMSVPKPEGDPVDWIVAVSKSQRRVMLKHPEVIPMISRGYLRTAGFPAYQTATELLGSMGISESDVRAVNESIEAFIVGTVLVAFMANPSPTKDGEARGRSPISTNAGTKDEKLFEANLRALVQALVSRFAK